MIFNENGAIIDKSIVKDVAVKVLDKAFIEVDSLIAKKKRLNAISSITRMDDYESEMVDRVIGEIYRRISYSVVKHANDVRKNNRKLIGLSISRYNLDYDKYTGKELPCIPMFMINNPIFNHKSHGNMKKELIDILNSECEKEKYISIDFRESTNIDQVFLKFDIKNILADIRKDEE